MAHNYIEFKFCEYMIVQKAYTHRHVNEETACGMMEVSPKDLTEYLRTELCTTFKEIIHTYRIEEAKELWEKSGDMPIREIGHAVGYGSNMAFLYHFIRQERCLPHVWKRNNLIII